MSVDRVLGEDVLRSNHALREWSAGLRQWSRTARGASTAERMRARELRRHPPAGRSPGVAGTPRPSSSAERLLPALGEVRTHELLAVLEDQHGLSSARAADVLATGLLVAGYRPDDVAVSAADAFEIIDWALRGFA